MEHSYLYGISNLQSSTLQIDQQNVQTNFKGDEVVFSESDWSLISTDGRRNDGCGDRDYGEKASTNRSEGVDNGNVTSNGVEKNSSEDQQPRLIPIILQYATNSLVTLKPSRLEQLLDEAATEFQLDRTSIHLAVLIQQIPIKISQSIYSSLGPLSKVQVQFSNLQNISNLQNDSSRLWNSICMTKSAPSMTTENLSSSNSTDCATKQLVTHGNENLMPDTMAISKENNGEIDFSSLFGSTTIPQSNPNQGTITNNFLMSDPIVPCTRIDPTIDLGDLYYNKIFNTATTGVSTTNIPSPSVPTTLTVSPSPINLSSTNQSKPITPQSELAIPSPAPSDSSMITINSTTNTKTTNSSNRSSNSSSNNINSRKRFLINRSLSQQSNTPKQKFPFQANRKDSNESKI